VTYGWCRRGDERARNSLGALLDTVMGHAVVVLPFIAEAAVLAGRLRALGDELPPARAGDTRTKAERRMAWRMDLLIAATAYAHGYGVATRNRGDFERIAVLIDEAAPAGPPLDILPGPFG